MSIETEKLISKRTKLILMLPKFIVRNLRTYEERGDIDLNRFVETSLKEHKEYYVPSSLLGKFGNFCSDETLPIEIEISYALAFELGLRFTVGDYTTISDVAKQALGHSISILIDDSNFYEVYKNEPIE